MATKKSKTPPTAEQIADSKRLRDLFAERANMSQLEFGQHFDIGNQGMVWQYLNVSEDKGTALNVSAAIKFARGLKVQVGAFSPTLQKAINEIAAFGANNPYQTEEKVTALTVAEPPAPNLNHVNPEIAQMIALMESTDDVGRGIILGAASSALSTYRPTKRNAA